MSRTEIIEQYGKIQSLFCWMFFFWVKGVFDQAVTVLCEFLNIMWVHDDSESLSMNKNAIFFVYTKAKDSFRRKNSIFLGKI